MCKKGKRGKGKNYVLVFSIITSIMFANRNNLFPETNYVYEWEVPATKDLTLYIMAKRPHKKPELLFKVGPRNGRTETLYISWLTDKNVLGINLSYVSGTISENIFGGSFQKVLKNRKLNQEGTTKLLESYDKKSYIYSEMKKEIILGTGNKNLYHKEFKDEKFDLAFTEIKRADNYSIIKSIDKTGYDAVGAGLSFFYCCYEIARLRKNNYYFPAIQWLANEEDTYLHKVYFFNDNKIKLKTLLGDDYYYKAQERFNQSGYDSVAEFGDLFINPRKRRN